uniref:Uncharacterized protein n=1 Tax=Escherichia coli ACN001 TaxID=1311757 RepID=A0A140WZ38_ECOLX|nr:hypothetical protein J444_pF61 [Escherichia coli ACN001]
MPGTASVTVWVAAHTGATAAARAREANSFFMMNSWLIEKWNDIGKSKRDQDQHGHDPENQLVGGAHLRNRADLTWLACLHGPVNPLPGEEQRH